MATSDLAVEPAELSVRAYPLVGLLAAACLGAEIDYRVGVTLLAWLALLLSGTGLWWVFWRLEWYRAAAWLVFLAVVSLSGMWHHDRWYLFCNDDLARYAQADRATPVCLLANALEPPSYRPATPANPLSTVAQDPTSRLLVEACALRRCGGWQSVSGRAMLVVQGRLPPLVRGARLQIVGVLFRARHPQNPGMPDYAALARGRRCLSLVVCRYRECVRVCRQGSLANPRSWFGRLRLSAQHSLGRYVGDDWAPLASALILGQRQSLDDNTVSVFFGSGTLHLLAISGLHVGILASALWLGLRLEGWARPMLLWLTFGVVLAYASLTGLRTPVLRATVLVAAYCIARGAGRRGTAWNYLAAAGLVTLVLHPAAVREPAAQLSFLAVATIIRAWPWLTAAKKPDPLARLIARSRPLPVRLLRWFAIRTGRALALSALVWLVTAPLVAACFHLLAPVAIVLNLVLWMPVVLAMFTGIGTIVAAPIMPWLARGLGVLCAGSLHVTYAIAHWTATWSAGHWYTAGPPQWWLIGFYFGLAIGAAGRQRAVRRWRWHMLVIWLCVGLLASGLSARARRTFCPRPLQITFIAVGHGLSVLVELPDGRNLLYDAGRMGTAKAAAAPICSVLWSRGISHIDAIVLSHADVDHFNAVPDLLKRFSVGVVYVTPVMFRHLTPAVAQLQAAMRTAGVPVREIEETDQSDFGAELRMEVLNPPPGGCGDTDNSNSLVLLLTYNGCRFLLAGDLEGAGLEELLAEENCHCDVMVAPHHGSLHSCPDRVMEWATPAWVVISDAAHGSVRQAIVPAYRRAAQVIHLGHAGACRMVLREDRLHVAIWQNRWVAVNPARRVE